MSKHLQLPFGIDITIEHDGLAHLESQLRKEFVDGEDEGADNLGNAVADAMECLLLALAAAEVDLDTPAARSAIESAVENVVNLVF